MGPERNTYRCVPSFGLAKGAGVAEQVGDKVILILRGPFRKPEEKSGEGGK